jgi:predicted enzyme related to lactoylglutathione lyase
MAITAKMVTIDCADPGRLAEFWTRALDYRVAGEWDGYILLVPDGGATGMPLGLQPVPEPRVAKNRVHIDFEAADRPAEVARLVELGAALLREEKAGDNAWSVLEDPEGNCFCVSG